MSNFKNSIGAWVLGLLCLLPMLAGAAPADPISGLADATSAFDLVTILSVAMLSFGLVIKAVRKGFH